jgi:predicted Zn-dependent protease
MNALPLADQVVELVRRRAGSAAEAEVMVHSAAEALTRFANSAIHQNVAEDTTTVWLRLHADGRTAAGSTTLTGAAGLESLVERTIAAARLSPPEPGWPGLTAPTALAAGNGDGVDEAIVQASPADRAARVRDFVRAAGGLETAGYCRTSSVSAAFANSAGQSVEGRTAEAAMDGIARTGGADGVARRAVGRLADLDGAALGAQAAAKARAGVRAVELPPGRYEVVLEPCAVADVLANLAWFGFNGKAFAERQSFAELGAAQFDPAVTIVDEPLGRGGEPAPGLPFDVEGTPRSAVTLVRGGTTAAVAHDRRSAAEAGTSSTGHASPSSHTWGPMATHLRLEPSGTAPADPVAEPARALVNAMSRGLLITDFWYTRVLDQKSLVITGLTRNGVWLVEDGEVTTAVSNLRFTQSYPHALGPGAIRGIGSTAVALPARWPGGRCTTPALHLASWNVTGNASG